MPVPQRLTGAIQGKASCAKMTICVQANVCREIDYSLCKQKMMSFRGQAGWAKMTSPGGKLTALGCHPTKINKLKN
jgi:hypothetical protein